MWNIIWTQTQSSQSKEIILQKSRERKAKQKKRQQLMKCLWRVSLLSYAKRYCFFFFGTTILLHNSPPKAIQTGMTLFQTGMRMRLWKLLPILHTDFKKNINLLRLKFSFCDFPVMKYQFNILSIISVYSVSKKKKK